MRGTTTVILGGGWGGLACAHALRALLPAEHRIIVVERRAHFSLCMSYLGLLTGEHENPSSIRRAMATLARPGIELLEATAESIDGAARRVSTSAGTIDADFVVIALGAELAPSAVRGLAEHAHNLYEADGAMAIGAELASIEHGEIVVVVASTPFRCPAAPYEAALLAEWMLRRRGVRENVHLSLYTPEKQPMPVAGAAVGAAVRSILTGRGIDYLPEHRLSAVDSTTLDFEGQQVAHDLLIAVPPHRAPAAVVASGLTDGSGYVPVHPGTMEILSDPQDLETKWPGVFAIGDVAAIRLMNGMLLPKAGVFVEAEAQVVAANIAALVSGDRARARYDGRGFCYLEVGDGQAAYSVGDFYAFPAPRVELEPPAVAHKRAKQEFERLLETWFLSPRATEPTAPADSLSPTG
jgi:sulfide:quinone oxidoreductase